MAKRNLAEQIRNLYELTKTAAREAWVETNLTNWRFFKSEQLTAKEKDALEERGMPTFIINKITPAIEMIVYFVTAGKPKWVGIPAEESDAEIAKVHNAIADYIWNISNGRAVFASVVRNALVKSVGYFQVDVDPDMDNGLGEVIIKSVDPFSVFVDPQSSDTFYRDASYIGIMKVLPRSKLMSLFPEKEKLIRKASATYTNKELAEIFDLSTDNPDSYSEEEAVSPLGEVDELIDYYEVYFKEKHPYINLFYYDIPNDMALKQIEQQAKEQLDDYAKELDVQFKEFEAQINQQLAAGVILPDRAKLELEKKKKENSSLLEQKKLELMRDILVKTGELKNIIIPEEQLEEYLSNPDFVIKMKDKARFYKTRIRLTIVVGDKLIDDYYFPDKIEDYPIIPIPYIPTDSPYPIALTSLLVGKQEEINKAHQIVIHNANLGSSLRWLAQEGSINEKEWESYASVPGAILKYRMGTEKPVEVVPAPLNNAFFTLVQEAKQDIEELHGISKVAQGQLVSGDQTYRGILALDEFSTRRVRQWLINVIEPGLQQLGQVVKQFAQSFYTTYKKFRIVQPNPITKEVTTEDYEINKLIYNDMGEAIEKAFNYEEAKFDVYYVSGSSLPVNRWALLDQYLQWLQVGVIDDIAFLSVTDIPNKQDIIKRKSLLVQMKQQLEALQEELKQKDAQMQMLQKQLINARSSVEVAREKLNAQAGTLQLKAMQKYFKKIMNAELSDMRRDIKQLLRTFQKELELSKREQLLKNKK